MSRRRRTCARSAASTSGSAAADALASSTRRSRAATLVGRRVELVEHLPCLVVASLAVDQGLGLVELVLSLLRRRLTVGERRLGCDDCCAEPMAGVVERFEGATADAGRRVVDGLEQRTGVRLVDAGRQLGESALVLGEGGVGGPPSGRPASPRSA